MTAERPDFDRALRQWFEDGPTVMSDRVVDDIGARIARQPQRSTWRLRGRPFMNTYAKLASAAAAVLIVGYVGWQLLPGNGGVGGSPTLPPTHSPNVAATPGATRTVAPTILPVLLGEGPLEAGPYVTLPFPEAPDLRVNFSMPAGWEGFPATGVVGPNGTGAPGGLAIAFLSATGLFSDPCQWDQAGDGTWPQAGDVAVGSTVNDLITAFRANTAYDTTAPVDISIGGYSGRQLELQVPASVDLSSCDRIAAGAVNAYFAWSAYPAETGVWAQGPEQRWRLSIFDVDGDRVFVVLGYFASTSVADLATAEEIIDSIRFSR